MVLQGFAVSKDRYKFKDDWCPKLDPVTGAIELQNRFYDLHAESTQI